MGYGLNDKKIEIPMSMQITLFFRGILECVWCVFGIIFLSKVIMILWRF